MTSPAEDRDKQKAAAPWQTIRVTPNAPRTNGSDRPGHQEALENSFCCLGCARGQTFTSTSDRTSNLRQNMHVQNTESACGIQSELFYKVLISSRCPTFVCCFDPPKMQFQEQLVVQ